MKTFLANLLAVIFVIIVAVIAFLLSAFVVLTLVIAVTFLWDFLQSL